MDFYFCEAEKSVKILLHAVGLDKHGLLWRPSDEKIRANPFNLCHPPQKAGLYRNKKDVATQ
jgi:hypothetical protein